MRRKTLGGIVTPHSGSMSATTTSLTQEVQLGEHKLLIEYGTDLNAHERTLTEADILVCRWIWQTRMSAPRK
jgi:hypothetical protein